MLLEKRGADYTVDRAEGAGSLHVKTSRDELDLAVHKRAVRSGVEATDKGSRAEHCGQRKVQLSFLFVVFRKVGVVHDDNRHCSGCSNPI
jgi:hypothetical protein